MRRTVALVVAAACAAAAFVPTGNAGAAHPGGNGRVVFERNDDPFSVPASGGQASRVRRISETAHDFRYSPNSKKIAFSVEVPDTQVWVMNADGTRPRSVTGRVDACLSAARPTWSPDGTRLAFTCLRSDNVFEQDIYSVELDGTGVRRITKHGDAYFAAWAPKGGKIAFTTWGNQIFTVPANGGRHTLLSNEAPGQFGGSWNDIDWSPNGAKLVAEATGDGIYVLDGTTGAVVHGTYPGGIARIGMEPAFSPNGKRIVYVGGSGSNTDLWTMNIDGTNKQQLTSGPAKDRSPNWGPK